MDCECGNGKCDLNNCPEIENVKLSRQEKQMIYFGRMAVKHAGLIGSANTLELYLMLSEKLDDNMIMAMMFSILDSVTYGKVDMMQKMIDDEVNAGNN